MSMTAWQTWQDSPWGRLRYAVAGTNLARHLGGAFLRVLDLGGGDGLDSVGLAAAGHDVTIVDRDTDMLAAARERAGAAGAPVTLVQADVAALPHLSPFDVVLCHNVIPYVSDVQATLRVAVDLLRAGGLLSVMSLNRHSAPLVAAIREVDPVAALAALDTAQSHTATFDTAITLHTAEDIGATLTELGCAVDGHYGIRSFCDYITDDERKHDPTFFADLERLELAVTDREPYKHVARMFQLIARRA
ncbi:methyltransferase domain-containing protein [Pseudonocardia sp. TRM90224]|uniref:methyltransferase domain-containing protein n=1 Tax=Pseudonocardia sp. TRM90224 TaxID=2812678 RepID=UPI001E3D0B01|nr:methyltransferase domain-containing protein [Pseudonocardia sp. TRM90224]